MKKFLLLSILVLGFQVILLENTSNADYSEDFQNAYKFAYKNGITNKETIDKAKLDSPLTRIAMAKMLSNYAINVLGKKPDTSKGEKHFSDVTEQQNNDYDNAVTLSYQLGIMGQGTKYFRPNDEVTRAEFATALSRMLYSTQDGNPYYTTHLKKLKEEGIITKDNPEIKEKRGYVMLMLMRSNDSAENITNNEEYLTQEDVQKFIEKKEGLKEDSLNLRGYECDEKKCNYEFEYSIDGKTYIYYKDNTASGKIEKIQDLGIDAVTDIAVKDAKASKDDVIIGNSIASNGITSFYVITITSKDNVLVYSMSLDGKIIEKHPLITGKEALEVMLKEVGLQKSKVDIEKENEEICLLRDEEYRCSFTYGGKEYTSFIDAKDGTFIPTKKSASGFYQFGEDVEGKVNVIISEAYAYIDSDKVEELLTEKYNIEAWSSSISMAGEGENAIYIYKVGDLEYYIDALKGEKMYSKDEIFTSLAKDSGVSKDIIKNSKKKIEDSESMDANIIETINVDEKTKDVVSIYSFNDQGIIYTYKVRIIDGKILDSMKETDIGEDKAIELAKQTILNKYSVKLKDEYENNNRSRAYMRYVSISAIEEFTNPQPYPIYVITFTDTSDENMYRVVLKYNGDIISEDKTSVEELEQGFFTYLYYNMGYSLDEINERKNE